MNKAIIAANGAKPSVRQLLWQETEFYGLISYGLPVFTGKQYGGGFTPPAVFWPEDMDTDSWCEIAKDAGMKGLLLTCKHYDGFCLWPTKYTDYSVASSAWMDGQGDLVRLTAQSCKKYGLKFGIYLAPWDRHEKSYGQGEKYDDFFCGLLEELLTGYGEIFCVWLDGVVGADEKRTQNYNWGRYYSVIRSLMPNAVIAFMGPDVRWCGNETGMMRDEEWSPQPAYLGVTETGDSPAFSGKKKLDLRSAKLGDRKSIEGQTDFIWYPCELSMPMRKHWFFDEEDKYNLKTKDKLLKYYFGSVGNNSCFMLGLSPNKRGVLEDNDTQILRSFGKEIALLFGSNVVDASTLISASSEEKERAASSLKMKSGGYWRPESEDKKPWIEFRFQEEMLFDKIVLSENICNGQHIEEFEIFTEDHKMKLRRVYTGKTVGYKRICCIPPAKTKRVRIVFYSYRSFFELSGIQIN